MDSASGLSNDAASTGEGFQAAQPPLADGELEGATFLFVQLAKAARICNLYPDDNRICIEFLDRAHNDFTSFLNEHRKLEVTVQEETFNYKGRVAYRELDLRKSLPMRLFRDGVRKLVFYEGFEHAELTNLIEVLNTVSPTDDLDHDAVTLLWEKDFANLSYFVIEDPYLDEEEADVSQSLCLEPGPGAGEPYVPPKLSPQTIASVLAVTDHDLSVARTLIARETARNLRHDLTTLLFEMLSLRRDDEGSFRQTIELLGRISGIYVNSDLLGEAAEILQKLREVLDLDLTSTQRALIHSGLAANRNSEVMRQIEQIFDRPNVRNSKDAAAFLRLLGPEVVPELMRIISSAAHPKILVQVMLELNARGTELLLDSLKDPDPEVVRRMLEILGTLQAPRFVPPILREIEHPVLAVRLAAIRAVAGTAGPEARDGLISALKNSVFQVRVQALKGLEGRSDPRILPLLIGVIDTEEFRKRGAPEQQEFLYAIARIGEEASVEILKELLDRAGMFSAPRTRRLAQFAAAALGRIDCVEAHNALSFGSRPRGVREACRIALSNRPLEKPAKEQE